MAPAPDPDGTVLRLPRDRRYYDHRSDEQRRVRDRLAADLEGVDGWLLDEEACALHEAARRARADGGPPLVVEIGSWKGRSSIALARGLGARPEPAGKVLAIDPHTGSREHRELWGEVDTYAEFLANVERAGVRDRLSPRRMTSREARAAHDGRPVHVLFIDGSHEYADVRDDLDDWLPLLAPGAVVGFNDVLWPGVLRALREKVLIPGSGLRRPALIQNTLFMTREGDAPLGRRGRRSLMLFRTELLLRFLLARAIVRAGRLRAAARAG